MMIGNDLIADGHPHASTLADGFGGKKRVKQSSLNRFGHAWPVIGEVDGKHCILFDDIVDSGGTLVHAADALKGQGAASASAYVSHAVLSGEAVQRIANSQNLTRLVVTDSIGNEAGREGVEKIETISIDRLLAEAIRRIANEESVSSLFD